MDSQDANDTWKKAVLDGSPAPAAGLLQLVGEPTHPEDQHLQANCPTSLHQLQECTYVATATSSHYETDKACLESPRSIFCMQKKDPPTRISHKWATKMVYSQTSI